MERKSRITKFTTTEYRARGVLTGKMDPNRTPKPDQGGGRPSWCTLGRRLTKTTLKTSKGEPRGPRNVVGGGTTLDQERKKIDTGSPGKKWKNPNQPQRGGGEEHTRPICKGGGKGGLNSKCNKRTLGRSLKIRESC